MQYFGRCRKNLGLSELIVHASPETPFKKVIDAVMYLESLDHVTMKDGIVYETCLWWCEYWKHLSELKTLRLQSNTNYAQNRDLDRLTVCSNLTELEITQSAIMHPVVTIVYFVAASVCTLDFCNKLNVAYPI